MALEQALHLLFPFFKYGDHIKDSWGEKKLFRMNKVRRRIARLPTSKPSQGDRGFRSCSFGNVSSSQSWSVSHNKKMAFLAIQESVILPKRFSLSQKKGH